MPVPVSQHRIVTMRERSMTLLCKAVDTKQKLIEVTDSYLMMDYSDMDLSTLQRLLQVNTQYNKLLLDIMKYVLEGLSYEAHPHRSCDAA